ncbi:putative protein N(5)-glutamine methyltransferase [Nocardioides donggukensis]|uniref:peptide chain release factor N(5)-glutamine methyltransferase n=1 Tax=Nocardioides donggukensis TaxID=2774019 RepID=A0A927K495_9ACTN|nr:putative protein N(5)-glutamine methyltransferase [Nocardioides donggukensis]MBD8869556.1 putative protein N(5)-glutamine methyltransferase [Nocardioides donggukensis]
MRPDRPATGPGDDDRLVARLRAAGCVFAEDEALLLRQEAGPDPARLEELVAARVAGRPLEALLGWAEFWGVRVVVEPGVFVPRRRTGLVVDVALDRLRGSGPGEVVVDLCCGAGGIGAALLSRRPDLDLLAVDVDEQAVRCAARNVVPLGGRVARGDLYDALPENLRGRVRVLAVNAPYVPTDELSLLPPEARLHERRVALDGGPDGLDVQRRVVRGAPEWLAPGGWLLVETGRAQVEGTLALLAAAGLDAGVARDDARHATVVSGRRSPEGSGPARSRGRAGGPHA